MTITGTSSATDRTAATSLGSPTATGATGSTFDSQSFMRLLIAQIQHQDPLQPMDASQMTQQLTSLTQVERLVSIDSQLGSLSIATASVANAQATDLVGREVQADTSRILLNDGAGTQGTFVLPTAATTCSVDIRDSQGRVVRTIDVGASPAGPIHFEWDGHDVAGNRADAGSYTIAVRATNSDGGPITASTRVSGVVGSITYDNGYPELDIDGTHVMLGDVRSVGEPPAPSPTAAGSSTSTTP